MSEIATNLASTATNLLQVSTNAPAMPHGCVFDSSSITVLLLMAAGVILGSFGSFCYQRAALPSEKARDKWELLKILGMGIASVALVPAFLRTVSSNLIKETETSFEAKLVFIAFCVAATLAAKKFIGTLPEKLLNLANKAVDQAAEAQSDVRKVAEVVAERTAKPVQEPAATSDQRKVTGPVSGYDWKEVLIIRALLNPKYTVGRTGVGLAFDSGLTVTEVNRYLQKLQDNGDVAIFTGNPIKGPLWHLTQLGRQKVASLRFEGGSGSVADVGIE